MQARRLTWSVWRRRGWVVLFAAYALALFTATHWPGLALPEGEVARPDLYVHFGVFATWTVLLGFSHLVGDWRHGRGVVRVVAVAAVYAAIDEGLQMIPALRRVAVWDDLLANLGGVVLGGGALLALRVIRRRRRGR